MKYKNDINSCIEVLKNGGLILYPTDTIWGIGCDATNEAAVNKIFAIKQRASIKAMIILVSDELEVNRYVQQLNPGIFSYLSEHNNPITVIYKNGINVASNLLNEDGSIAMRIVKEDFCRKLIKQFGKPIVSTSANTSGENAPLLYRDISQQIKKGVDYIVQHRQNDLTSTKPSSIIKIDDTGDIEVIRE